MSRLFLYQGDLSVEKDLIDFKLYIHGKFKKK